MSDASVFASDFKLSYVSDQDPGIRRQKRKDAFRYLDTDGHLVRDEKTLLRIKRLAIPPAWTDVWICPRPNGHLQATGRDARNRKQYRYHAFWRESRDKNKYEHVIAFAHALPKLRERVQRDLALSNLPREKVLATVVSLLEQTQIRVGNEEYARTNRSFGLTTLRNRHVKVEGASLRFEFRGKSGKRHSITLRSRRLANIVRRCQELEGQELFQYVDRDGVRHGVSSQDVNDYIREAAGADFTAKDFRTWAGTVLAARELSAFEPFETDTAAKRNVVQAIEAVSHELGNTPAVCRKCYVHPDVLDVYLEGSLADGLRREQRRKTPAGLTDEEAAVLNLLRTAPLGS